MFFKKIKEKFIKNDKSILDEWAKVKNAEGFFSVLERMPNPDIVLKKTGKRIIVYRTLVNHYQVGTCIDSRKAGSLSCNFELKDCGCNKNEFDFYNEIFNTIDIYKLIEDILDAPLYGYNPIEINYEKDGSYIVPTSLIAKPQDWFYFNSENKFFFKDKTMAGKRQIDLNGFKFLLPRHKADFLNPYGQAILSRCFWNVAFISGGMEFFAKFVEHFGMPYIFGRYDRSTSDIEKRNMLDALVDMVQDAIGVIPNDSSVEVVPTGSTGSSDIYLGFINKCENNISKSILGQTLTTDIGDTGSYAAGAVHQTVRQDIVNSDKRLVEATINKFIKIINLINFNSDTVPVFEFTDEEDLGLQKAERDNKIKTLGVKFSKEYLIRTYGYQKSDIEIIDNFNNTSINFSDTNNNYRSILPTKQGDFSVAKSAYVKNNIPIAPEIKNILTAEDMQKQITPALNLVIEFFEKTRNADDAIEKLAELYPELNTEELEEMLTKVIFASELKGRLEAQK